LGNSPCRPDTLFIKSNIFCSSFGQFT
jgi:hypothetical protein